MRTHELTAKVEMIDPVSAASWLDRDADNAMQRKISDAHVAALAAEMSEGRWRLNGETVVFNGASILDGRHRLKAVVKSGCTVPMLVVRNVPAEVFPTFDIGKRRSGGDVLGMSGHVQTNALAAAARFVRAEERGALKSVRQPEGACPPDVILDVVGRHAALPASVAHAKGVSAIMPHGMASYCHYRALQCFGTEFTEEFFAALRSGENVSKTMPVYHLREQLIGQTRNRRIPTIVQLAMTMKALMYTAEGRQIRLLTFRPSEEFPEWPRALEAKK